MTLRPLYALLFAAGAAGCAGPAEAPDPDTAATEPLDEDGDGYLVTDGDCAEDDAAVHPGAPEACNGVDDDCDGVADEDAADAPAWYGDSDGDGYGATAVSIRACEAPSAAFVADDADCDDGDATVHPGAEEACTDPTDRNCDGSVGATDADGDGVAACEDCDDADATAFPGALEACGGGDEDCDGETDQAGADGELDGYADADGDTYGDAAVAVRACALPEGFVADNTDCDDAAAGVNPGAAEVCGGGDEDCDGAVDDADPSVATASLSTWHIDYDGDSFGAAGPYDRAACVAPVGWIADATDCDDSDAASFPGGEERCDGAGGDEDCDGLVDDADPTATGQTEHFIDADGDGHGEPSGTVWSCDLPAGYSDASDDCDDADAAVSPDAAERCDAADLDEDCDGAADDDDPGAEDQRAFYFDGDNDGFGNAAVGVSRCDATVVWIADATDCDDALAAVYPGADETVGNEDDDDCDGYERCYVDADGDGYHDTNTVESKDEDCADEEEATSAAPDGDCDDADADVSPGGTESCNGVDDDCDGATDEDVGAEYYVDADEDGYGDSAGSTIACSLPSGYAEAGGDCDDTSALASPGGTEACGDGLDNDCDEAFDDCNLSGEYVALTADMRLGGANSSDYYGRSVATGDFDGDGADDLFGGLPGADGPGSSAGSTVLSYGPLEASRAVPSSTDGRLYGPAAASYSGFSVAAGDHDGDGYDDLVVGAYGVSSYAGAAYLIYGGARIAASTSITTSVATRGATLTGGTALDYLGFHVASGGDMDGDGTDEIVVGAYLQDSGATSAGAAYLLYGSATRTSGTVASTAADATVLGVVSSGYLGQATAFVDDMDGDGLDELLVGAYGANSGTGAAYLFLGDTTPLSGANLASAADETYTGTAETDYAGFGVYTLGDLDGDGYGDAGVHGYGYDYVDARVGALWVHNGGTTLDAAPAAALYGASAGDCFGGDAMSMGDLDGDGTDDLLAGAYLEDTAVSSAGAAYLFYGPVSGVISAAAADATFYGAPTGAGHFGRRLPRDAADLTGDGLPDIAVGAYWDDTYGYDAGAIYIWGGLGGE